jgi:hypothetical protein
MKELRKGGSVLAVGALVSAGAFGLAAVPLATAASAAETHANCITFDSSGNVIGLTPNCSQTISQQGGAPQSFPGANPCTGDPGTATETPSHQVYHINVNGAGDAWDSGTMTSTVSFVPDDPSKPTGSGTSTNWFGDSFNAQNSVQHFTFNVSVHFSNGQNATLHEVGHITLTPNGPGVSFDKFAGWSCS